MLPLVAVYGSLRRGLWNHHILAHSEYVAKTRLPGWQMFSLGRFPGVRRGQGYITVEIYRVTPPVLKALDQMEGYYPEHTKPRLVDEKKFYDRVQVTTGSGLAHLYILEDRRYWQSPLIESGDWVGHQQES
ncbi:gamma-glutamylcyclotransferase [Aestuariirhabdus sp. Z084]|uniref:gamma-glutamylcyclotransferase family protein n=1 Tax=Aestuariirhabdus haliotis TaxID=2918751 RepID=UPI00201B3772|nr:gamma-glutamylcyclotransferase family protein [Aestuariirhabdus haliotis]MCL6415099.1 gamma-glutamylcyclotransferase [Aestuariirhabdus haliotis]MCL6419031.1 gamma-glutamylcyclotransferase [Aestuariirhabdus haliotis]